MSKHVVKLGDSMGRFFKIEVHLAFELNGPCNWRSIDKGFIRYHSGVAKRKQVKGTGDDYELICYNSDNERGIRLNDFEGVWFTNDDGTGRIVQSWVLNFEPGSISWEVVD